MSIALSSPSNPSILTSTDSPANSTTITTTITTTTTLTPPQQLKAKTMQPQQSHHHHHHLLQQQQQQHFFNQAKLENHLFSLTPAFLTTISSCQEDKENFPPSLSSLHHLSNRRVLRDITQALNRPSDVNPSTLALIHARSNRIIQQEQQKQQQHAGIARGNSGFLLRKKVVGYQHRKKMIPRRGAISLSREQAMEISRELSQLVPPQRSFSSSVVVVVKEDDAQWLQGQEEEKLYVAQKEEEEKKQAVSMQNAPRGATKCGSKMGIFPLDKNLFLITRSDGHTLRCPSRASAPRCGCVTERTCATLTAI